MVCRSVRVRLLLVGLSLLLPLGSASVPVDDETRRVGIFFVKHQQGLVKELEKWFHSVSDPQSKDYGNFLTFDDVVRLQTPHRESIDNVEKLLQRIGAVEISRSIAGDKIVASLPDRVKQGDLLSPYLDTVHITAGDSKQKVLDPHSVLKSPPMKRSNPHVARDADSQACLAQRVTPECLKKAYGLGVTPAVSNNSQAVVVNQGFKTSDLDSFCAEHGLSKPPSINVVGENSGEAGDEASLDMQFIQVGTNATTPTTYVYINGHSKNPFANWLVWAGNTSTIPLVHSLSVGEPEDEFASDNGGEQAVARVNSEIMAMGARGVSVIFASGDSGYQPAQKYGSSSPYVTSVGGGFNGDLGDDVLQVDDITTGGFSSLSVQPIQRWQTSAVASWLKTKGARPGKFNASRRCSPDIAVYDAGFYTIQDGSETVIGGTSAATPVFAGMVASLNAALIDAGKPPLGFLNYFLYQNADKFLDIVHGGNNGFDATVGYDPASGLGTFGPNTFRDLKAAALAH